MATDAASRPKRNRRRVVDPTGKEWGSVIDAALARNFSTTHVWTSAHLQRNGWRFADTPPRPPVARPSRRKA